MINYKTPIANDVIGYLELEEALAIAVRIRSLVDSHEHPYGMVESGGVLCNHD